MSNDQDENPGKIIDLANARKRQQTTHRSGATAERPAGRGPSGRMGYPNSGAPRAGGRPGFWAWVQFILVLLLTAYLLQLCSGGM